MISNAGEIAKCQNSTVNNAKDNSNAENQDVTELDMASPTESLFLAVRNSRYELAERLLQEGADPTEQDSLALRWACMSGLAEMVDLLLRHGASPGACDAYPLSSSATNGHLQIVRLLLAYKKYSRRQMTEAMERAARYEYFDIARLLIRNGADPSGLTLSQAEGLRAPFFAASLKESALAALEKVSPWARKIREEESEELFALRTDCFLQESALLLADLYFRPGGPGFRQAVSDCDVQ